MEWNCFPGSAPPDSVIRGWRALHGLPRAAQQNLWHLIDAALQSPEDPETRQLVDAYAQRFDANAAHLIAAVQACDYLLRQAASIGLTVEPFQADLEALSEEGERAGTELLCSRYDSVRALLRNRMLEDVLADHGRVLTSFDWRVDRLETSSRGHLGETPVVLIRLRYREGEKEDELSLQLPPAAVAALASFFDQFTAGASVTEDSNSERPST